ncbi:hypothetical protein PhCBS80983_g04317 [Powellomyces hirtus]|uniref:Hyaluronan/mRNA-binding protein domain-containing protein n=1 Tax=Powellomyces hirtus TaxID=109895 RepID=A0A507DZ94_9FUNG|nr:hypothetical protein PhCBS80983_g04317 [Powellomyces hirtus]
MTRSHTHSTGAAAQQHDRHMSRNGATASGSKKSGEGKHNWGDPSSSSSAEDLPLAKEFGDSNFNSVTDIDELERIETHSGDAGQKYQSRVTTVTVEEFANEKGVSPDTARRAARE